jgi:hypothetical protein
MEQLRPVELKLIDELFGMSSGYVLDFTNSTFADFFRREVGIDIYDNAYAIYGGSKGKHLRAFLTIDSLGRLPGLLQLSGNIARRIGSGERRRTQSPMHVSG